MKKSEYQDWPCFFPEWLRNKVMTVLTLFLFSYGFRGPGRVNRLEGAVLLSGYISFTAYLVLTVFAQAA